MKNITLAFFLFAMSSAIHAQYSKAAIEKYASRYGVKVVGGAIVSRPEITYIGNEKDYIIHEIELAHTLPQYAIGLWGQKRFGWLYSEANLLYSTYGMDFDVKTFSVSSIPLRTLREKFGYVDIQIMGGLISNGFRIAVGPVMHILVNHSSQLSNLQNYNQNLRSISYGFSGNIGYDLGKFRFDLKYDKAFRTVGDHIYYGYKKSQFLETPDGINLSIAYSIIN